MLRKKWIVGSSLDNDHTRTAIFSDLYEEKIALSKVTCHTKGTSNENDQKGISEVLIDIRKTLVAWLLLSLSASKDNSSLPTYL